jgi:hypothetical protein
MAPSNLPAPAPADTVGSDPARAVRLESTDLAEALRTCCIELMADYGVQATWVQGQGTTNPPPQLSAFIAVAEFAGESMHGSVGLRATRGVLAQTARDVIDSESHRLLADWTCELVNQLLGRLKGKLLEFEVALDTKQPRLVGAERLEQLERAVRYRFSCEFGDFSGYLDLVLAPGFVLKRRESTEPLPGEGDILLF